jgi:hypothetical protein
VDSQKVSFLNQISLYEEVPNEFSMLIHMFDPKNIEEVIKNFNIVDFLVKMGPFLYWMQTKNKKKEKKEKYLNVTLPDVLKLSGLEQGKLIKGN